MFTYGSSSTPCSPIVQALEPWSCPPPARHNSRKPPNKACDLSKTHIYIISGTSYSPRISMQNPNKLFVLCVHLLPPIPIYIIYIEPKVTPVFIARVHACVSWYSKSGAARISAEHHMFPLTVYQRAGIHTVTYFKSFSRLRQAPCKNVLGFCSIGGVQHWLLPTNTDILDFTHPNPLTASKPWT